MKILAIAIAGLFLFSLSTAIAAEDRAEEATVSAVTKALDEFASKPDSSFELVARTTAAVVADAALDRKEKLTALAKITLAVVSAHRNSDPMIGDPQLRATFQAFSSALNVDMGPSAVPPADWAAISARCSEILVCATALAFELKGSIIEGYVPLPVDTNVAPDPQWLVDSRVQFPIFAGMAPEAIPNAEVRQKYLRKLAANEKAGWMNNRQSLLRAYVHQLQTQVAAFSGLSLSGRPVIDPACAGFFNAIFAKVPPDDAKTWRLEPVQKP